MEKIPFLYFTKGLTRINGTTGTTKGDVAHHRARAGRSGQRAWCSAGSSTRGLQTGTASKRWRGTLSPRARRTGGWSASWRASWRTTSAAVPTGTAAHEANQNRLGKLIKLRTPVLWKVNWQSLCVGSDNELDLHDGSIEPIRKANQSENTCSLDGTLLIYLIREW